jgi:Uma2 family endonuclease
MSAIRPVPPFGLVFPDSDGQPMAENTRQYEAIVTLKGNIEAFAPADAFVAGDHLVYVDARDPAARQAPDVYVAFGRPRGHRGSYKVWEEGNVFPQVIFEVLGPSNTAAEMRDKRRFYFAHGAEEYYEFDPEAGTWLGFVLNADTGLPDQVKEMDGHVSPRLGMRFAFRPLNLLVFRPDGSRFLSFQELNDWLAAERERAEREKERAEQQKQENERLRAMLRAAGIDPDKPPPG